MTLLKLPFFYILLSIKYIFYGNIINHCLFFKKSFLINVKINKLFQNLIFILFYFLSSIKANLNHV